MTQDQNKYQWRKYDESTVKAVFNKSGGRCWYCGKKLTLESRFEKLSGDTYCVEHFVARKNGGSDDLQNLVPACWSCNSHKGTRTLEEFRDFETRLKNNAPRFTDEQLLYLERNCIKLPYYEPHMFYFEREGLQP